jgi:tripartite-type tricarboxylate transporter receptor subunit TctC
MSLRLDMTHVPFGGSGPAIQSLIGGHTPIAFTTIPPASALIADGRIRPIAVLAKTRAAALPDVPTMEEAGFAGQEGNNFQGLLAPAGTPRPIIEKLHDEVVRIVKMPETVKRFEALGLDVIADKPAQFAQQIEAEIDKWAEVVKAAHLKIE